MFIIDIGSGNTLTDTDTACKIIKTIKDFNIPDSYVKFQLFKEAGNNIPLDLEVFERAARYCHIIGMPYGASVFDEDSMWAACFSGALKFLKLANNHDLHYLIEKSPQEDRWMVSTDNPNLKIDKHGRQVDLVYCVSKYPADEKDYSKFGDKLKQGMSDHTTNWNLFKKYQPKIYECHFCLEDSEGLDAGKFARRPKDLEKLVNNLYDTSIEEVMKEEYENSMHDSGKIGVEENTEKEH